MPHICGIIMEQFIIEQATALWKVLLVIIGFLRSFFYGKIGQNFEKHNERCFGALFSMYFFRIAKANIFLQNIFPITFNHA